MAFVYWIHLPEHTDIFTEGYVGFTTQHPSRRFTSHKHDANTGGKRRLSNALRKYGDKIVFSVVLEGSDEYCLEIENKLRSKEHTGWNHGVGGKAPALGVSMPEEVKQKISNNRKGIRPDKETAKRIGLLRVGFKYSEEFKIKMSNSAKNRMRYPWENSRANKEIWNQAQDIYAKFIFEPNLTKLARLFDIEPCKFISIVNKFKNGWIPEKDEKWLSFKEKYESSRQGMKTQEASTENAN